MGSQRGKGSESVCVCLVRRGGSKRFWLKFFFFFFFFFFFLVVVATTTKAMQWFKIFAAKLVTFLSILTALRHQRRAFGTPNFVIHDTSARKSGEKLPEAHNKQSPFSSSFLLKFVGFACCCVFTKPPHCFLFLLAARVAVRFARLHDGWKEGVVDCGGAAERADARRGCWRCCV